MTRKESNAEYYLKNKETIIARVKEYRRTHAIRYGAHSKKKSIYGIIKSPYPQNSICSYCGKQVDSLQYHHWDDSNTKDGIWVCRACHMRIRRILWMAGLMPIKREALINALKCKSRQD